MYTRQRREEGRVGDGRERGDVERDRAKRFRKRQTNKVWGHEWVERSQGVVGGSAVEEVMEG